MNRIKPIIPGLLILSLFSCHPTERRPFSSNLPVDAADPRTATRFPAQLQLKQQTALIQFAQHYTATGRQWITGRKGIRIYIDPAQLETESGQPVQGRIDLTLLELTNTKELLQAGAATLSNGQLLVSGGSYFIELKQQQQSLRIKPGHHLSIQFPRLSEESMELFYGQRNEAGIMNWNAASSPLDFQPLTLNRQTSARYPVRFSYQPDLNGQFIFDSTTQRAMYVKRPVTFEQLVAELNKQGVEAGIDTLKYFYRRYIRNKDGKTIDSTPLIPCFRYRLITPRLREKENRERDSVCFLNEQLEERFLKSATEEEKRLRRMEEQVNKYYQSSGITQLGWINCDRFFRAPERNDLPIELPITQSAGSRIDYFIVFRDMNSIYQGVTMLKDPTGFRIAQLPTGQAITVLAYVQDSEGKLTEFQATGTVQNTGLKLKLHTSEGS